MATRFCPSPTGLLHLGNVRTALFNRLLAKKHGLPFLLRIEDTDRERCRDEYEKAILEDLAWLGLEPEGEILRQSQRRQLYLDHLDRLRDEEQIYPCFCSDAELKIQRQTQLSAGRPPRYEGTCLNLDRAEVERRVAAGQPHAWRFRVPGEQLQVADLVYGDWQADTGLIGDFVVLRRDGEPTFLFCNALDDALSGVQFAVRGEDHLSNTPRQLMLLKALGLTAPRYGHLSMLKGSDGKPLSKRDGSGSVQGLRNEGYMAIAILNQVFRLGHGIQAPGLLDMDAMADALRLESVSRSPALWTRDDLKHWQKLAVEQAPIADLVRWTGLDLPADRDGEAVAEFLRPNLLLPADAADWPARLFGEQLDYSPQALEVFAEAGGSFFSQALDCWSAAGQDWADFTARLSDSSGRKGRKLFLPVRMALSGQAQGPELDAMAALMGAKRVAERFARVAELLAA